MKWPDSVKSVSRAVRQCLWRTDVPSGKAMSVNQVLALAYEMRGTGFASDLLTGLDAASQTAIPPPPEMRGI